MEDQILDGLVGFLEEASKAKPSKRSKRRAWDRTAYVTWKNEMERGDRFTQDQRIQKAGWVGAGSQYQALDEGAGD